MQPKASELFICACCGEPHPEPHAFFDEQWKGPVCTECRSNSKWAVAWMKRAKIAEPLRESDLNPQLKARFNIP